MSTLTTSKPAASTHTARPISRKKVLDGIKTVISHLVLIVGSFFFVVPLIFMISTSLKATRQIAKFPPELIPNPFIWGNYPDVFIYAPFFKYLLNTFFIIVPAVFGATVVSALAAYAFARMRAPGKNLIFMVLLATLMLPGAVTLVPTYLLFNALGWVNTLLPLIVPSFFGSAFFIFMLRQFYLTVPRELEEAAIIDGANPYQIWWRIMLPLSAPALATMAVFTFVSTYNDFFTPLIYLTDDSKQTIAVALSYFQGSPRVGPQMHLLMAAVALSIVPPMALFLVAQRYFVRGIATTGLKG